MAVRMCSADLRLFSGWTVPWAANDTESGSLDASPVNHGPSAPSWRDHHTAVMSPFTRCIGWREAEFAEQRAQGDVHLHIGERRADTAVHSSAEREPRYGRGVGADESARVKRRRVGEAVPIGQLDTD